MKIPALFFLTLMVANCGRPAETPAEPAADSFAADVAFLRAHTNVVVLASADGRSQVAVAPAYQGRVMTSSADGPGGASFGYIHRPGVQAGARQPHMTVLGGEDRFWLGPEGGQYALYFAPGAAFTPDAWQVPEPIDWDSWPVAAQNEREVSFRRDMTLTNYAGTKFSLRVDRVVRLIESGAALKDFGQAPGAATRVVAYETDNTITNTGTAAWKKETGLVSIWILGMYRPAPNTTVVIPFVPGPESSHGPIVNDKYFGKIDADRLRVTDTALYFKADGQKRGKIGVPRPRARDVAGSYDPERRVLTLVKFTLPGGATDYVNSMWEVQQQPFAGDVVNSYNDGPMTPGAAPMGPFYEIESSSPAAALAPSASLRHVHRTFHLQGPEAELDAIAKAALGVSLADISGK
jgi:hypothetical protein